MTERDDNFSCGESDLTSCRNLVCDQAEEIRRLRKIEDAARDVAVIGYGVTRFRLDRLRDALSEEQDG